MLPLPPVFSPNALTASLLNALLRREPWAADRLSRHAGKSLRFNIGPLQASYTIEHTGQLRACDSAITPDVSLTIGSQHLADLPSVLRSRDLNSITEKLHVQGDAALATLVSELARDLRWDMEEEFAGKFGDILGPGLLKGGRTVAGVAQEAVRRGAANLAEFLGEESRMLVTRHSMEAFSAGCQELERKLRELEQRMDSVERQEGKGA
ncbi:MAG TPA: SCP2 sterol-binding domain-containing protein [Burkholderiaceae bacterium]|nr:SCP2 sterol-binding domain-containing protein [Burkholderiaceae bacterium]